ncbi:protease pro-enzyme activation domain-containing protein [Rhodanobacter sp. L36]|uniref:S53 family peptidase n=1 Tax=Rhodanobacter sp. L36 TaxID=1747221 RepID=UPI001C204E26|nr:protease pro-enzyme activation domain-containing protein [Rhodanobacter sp. L36]
MKNSRRLQHAFIVVGLVALSTTSATPLTATRNARPDVVGLTEAPRITHVVDDTIVSMLKKSHLSLVDKLRPTGSVDIATPMNHMQLILQRSQQRTDALNALIADQHNPDSPRFQHWLTPAEYGRTFGIADQDIQAVTAWLASQGFKVNGVYPNKLQIDFSGTVGQVNHSFRTREMRYKLGDGRTHFAIANDISIPSALRPVVTGVAGLSNLHQKTEHTGQRVEQANHQKTQPETLPTANPRVLVPYDLAQMYNIAPLHANGMTGEGVTLAIVSDTYMNVADWNMFVNTFQLGSYGGTFAQIAPQPTASDLNNCLDPVPPPQPGTQPPGSEALAAEAEWATAMAPGANIVVANCKDSSDTDVDSGVMTAATNLVNSTTRPDIIEVGYVGGEIMTDGGLELVIMDTWAQADAEGISVFVSSGELGSGDSPVSEIETLENLDYDNGVDANAFASSPHVTAVGGTDTADVLDHTTSQYFSSTPNAVDGTALSYVPEIPLNQSCGNGVAATSRGWSSAVALCQAQLLAHPDGSTLIEYGTGGAPSIYELKPSWQKVTGTPSGLYRDVPDVAIFAGSYGNYTNLAECYDTIINPCFPHFFWEVNAAYGYGMFASTAMFAGIQAVMDQGLAARGLSLDQGNAAPTLYALAAQEYGTGTGSAPASLAACNSINGINGTSSCVFHNITRGSNSVNCAILTVAEGGTGSTPNCYIYGMLQVPGYTPTPIGLTALNTTAYNPQTKAYSAQPGWSYAAGLGSVNARNLLIAWRAFDHAAPAAQ